MDSSDEALCEMLGLQAIHEILKEDENEPASEIPQLGPAELESLVEQSRRHYQADSICILPRKLSVSGSMMRRLTEELVWGKDLADRAYETIQVLKAKGDISERRTLTRLENFVSRHDGWKDLCEGYLVQIVSAVLGEEMVLYKEKLNVKPPGSSGFAPHCDSPSLRIASGSDGPQTFCTVMVAIDSMTIQNGCLKVCKGAWSEEDHVQVIQPEQDGNPDAGGRAGAIPTDVADDLDFDDIVCQPGDIAVFNGWAPHRSKANTSPFPRRAVFLTYNPKREGDFHEQYYQRMEGLRNEWRTNVGLAGRQQLSADEQQDLDALATIPKI